MNCRRIAVLNLNDTRRDPRVRRISSTLVAQGHTVTVCEMRQPGTSDTERLDGYELARVDAPVSFTVQDMAALGGHSTAIGRIVHACDPRIDRGESVGRLRVKWRNGKTLLRSLLRRLRGRSKPAPCRFDDLQEILAIRSIMLLNVSLFERARSSGAEVVYCNDLDTLVAGAMLKSECGCKLVYDAHEIYAEQFADDLRSDLWHAFYTRLEQRLLPFTDARLTVCDSLGRFFEREYGAKPFVTVRNTPSIRLLADRMVLARVNDPVRFVYQGAYYPHRGLEEIVAVARRVPRARFVFRGIGSHVSELRTLVERLGMGDRVTFEEPVSIDQLVATASANDVGLNPFIATSKNTECALPNKFFEYMMAGLAIGSSNLVEMRSLTDELGVGVLFDAGDPDDLSRELTRFVDDPAFLQTCRQRAWDAAATRFHWEREQRHLLDHLAPVLAAS
ncbi:MAG: glycosyltransferase [Planctomycetota bacterium]